MTSPFFSDSPYGDMNHYPHPHGAAEYGEEPQTPTTPGASHPQAYGQMFEDAIDGGQHNSGSYNVAGQQQRRIIREIIV